MWRGGVEEAQQAQLVERRSDQLLPLLTSDPADSAQLFQAFSSTLPPSPCTPVATCQPPPDPYTSELLPLPLPHLQTSVAVPPPGPGGWSDSSCWLPSAGTSLTCSQRLRPPRAGPKQKKTSQRSRAHSRPEGLFALMENVS